MKAKILLASLLVAVALFLVAYSAAHYRGLLGLLGPSLIAGGVIVTAIRLLCE